MAMTLANSGLSAGRQQQQLEQQRADIDRQILLGQEEATAEERAAKIAEMASLTLTDDGTGRRLEAEIKTAEETLNAVRLEWHRWSANRIGQAAKHEGQRKPIREYLEKTAPACIALADEQLKAELDLAFRSVKSCERGGIRMSNTASVTTYVHAIQKARSAIGELRFTAASSGDAEKQIKRILKAMPKLNTQLVEVG